MISIGWVVTVVVGIAVYWLSLWGAYSNGIENGQLAMAKWIFAKADRRRSAALDSPLLPGKEADKLAAAAEANGYIMADVASATGRSQSEIGKLVSADDHP